MYDFAHYYWSVPLSFVKEKIKAWHPEAEDEQFDRILKAAKENIFTYHLPL